MKIGHFPYLCLTDLDFLFYNSLYDVKALKHKCFKATNNSINI